MYSRETTASERGLIADALNGTIHRIELARNTLENIWNQYFCESPRQAIPVWTADAIGDQLDLVSNVLFDAILEYALTVGDDSFSGVKPHLESTQQTIQTFKVEELRLAVCANLRSTTPQWDRVRDRYNDALKLPDDQAIPALEALLKEMEAPV